MDERRDERGSGPLTLGEFVSADHVVMMRFDGYFKEKAGVSKITVRSVPEIVTQIIPPEEEDIRMSLLIFPPIPTSDLLGSPGVEMHRYSPNPHFLYVIVDSSNSAI